MTTSSERPTPTGAMVAVISQSPEGVRHLLLHAADKAPGEAGDWAWGSPSGVREPGEDVAACAARELFEETGIRGEPHPVVTEGIGWALFFLEVPWGTDIRLDDAEHNDYTWADFDVAYDMCRPQRVADGFRIAVDAARGTQEDSATQ